MATTTKPIILDETGERIAAAIEGLYIGKRCLVNINNEGWGTVTGAGAYPSGQSVTLRAIPATGCGFLAWKDSNGNILGTDSTYTFTILNDTIIQAYFIDDETTEIVPWSTGNIQKIIAMLSAAYRGIIDVSDYWSVGDTRTVSLSAMSGDEYVSESHVAQDIEMTIMDFDCTGFKLASDGTTTPNAIVGMKNSLKESGSMNGTNTNVGGWNACARRGWCNSTFKNSIPSAEASIFKQFRWRVSGGGDGSLVSCDDYFGLAPIKCVINGQGVGPANEAALYDLWDWYSTSANRIKLLNGSAFGWWLCTARYGSQQHFCTIMANGVPDNDVASLSKGLSMFGCI